MKLINILNTKTLSQDKSYNPPSNGTYTSKIQNPEEIKKKLEGYKRVKDINKIPLGTHIRYITLKENRERFTLGGFLIKIEKNKYIVLTNNTVRWSVQQHHYRNEKRVFSTIFFAKISRLELCENALQHQHNEIEQLKIEKQQLLNQLHKKKRR